MPFKNMIDFNAYRNQIQLKYDGDDVVVTKYLTEFYHPFFEKIKCSEYDKGLECLYSVKDKMEKMLHPNIANIFSKM